MLAKERHALQAVVLRLRAVCDYLSDRQREAGSAGPGIRGFPPEVLEGMDRSVLAPLLACDHEEVRRVAFEAVSRVGVRREESRPPGAPRGTPRGKRLRAGERPDV